MKSYFSSRYACEIELNDKFVLTGGTDNDGTYGNPLTRVTSYDVYENVVVDLPELLEARMTHGCTYFSNNDNNQVKSCIYMNVLNNHVCYLFSIVGVFGGRGFLLQSKQVS